MRRIDILKEPIMYEAINKGIVSPHYATYVEIYEYYEKQCRDQNKTSAKHATAIKFGYSYKYIDRIVNSLKK